MQKKSSASISRGDGRALQSGAKNISKLLLQNGPEKCNEFPLTRGKNFQEKTVELKQNKIYLRRIF